MAATQNGSTNGAGEPKDLLSALAKAAVKWSATPTPDPKVSEALALGWRLGQASSWAKAKKPPDSDEFVGDAEARWAVLVGQIEGARERLAKSAAEADNSHPAGTSSQATGDPGSSLTPTVAPASKTADVTARSSGSATKLPEEPPPTTTAEDIHAFYHDALKEMWIADTSLGRALLLGYELQQLCDEPVDQSPDNFTTKLSQLELILLALASKLPPNAAHTVRNSLSLWAQQILASPPSKTDTSSETKTVAAHRSASPPASSVPSAQHIATCLREQGAVWRAILTGECAAKDLLRLSDYVGTAEEVVGRLHELAYSATRKSLRVWVAVIAVMVLAGVLVLIFANSPSGVAAGLTSLIAALGLTWKGIGTFIGQAAAKGEQALWDAQVDWTIAYRCTVSLSPEPKQQADNRQQRIESHVQKWKDWQKRWPSLDSTSGADG